MLKQVHRSKPENKKRIPVGVSVSKDRLDKFQVKLAVELGHEPTVQECKEKIWELSHAAIDAYVE